MEAIRQGDIPGVQLRCRHRMPVPPPTVWRWLTETDRLARWLCDRTERSGPANRSLVLVSTSEEGEVVRERMETVEEVRERLRSMSFERLDSGWPTPTRLVFELTPISTDTEFSVLQQGFAHLPLSDCLTIWETYRRRWRVALARLAEAIAADAEH